MSQDTEVLLVIWAFWLTVVGAALAALFHLRYAPVGGPARALWAIWIVAAPLLGPLSYFVVRPVPRAE